MKKFLTATLFCSLLISVVKAQMPMIDSFPYRSEVADMRLRMADQMPKGYKMEFGWEDLTYVYNVRDSLHIVPEQVQMAISHCMGDFRVLCKMPIVYTAEDSIELQYQKWHPDVTSSPNYAHKRNIIGDLMASQLRYRPRLDGVHYYSFSDSRRMFNADTVITYTMNMHNMYKDGIFKDKYTNLRVFVIHRRDRGYFVLYCFTTDKGQRDFKKHFRALQKIFRYED